jgi:uncharacterized phage protein gp47/JayE
MAFLTEDGFERPLQDDIAKSIATDLRGTISAQLDVSESTVIGNVLNIFADRIALAYETLEEAIVMLDPDNAMGERLVSLALLTGTERRDPQPGSVTVTCTLASNTVFDAEELVVHAVDDPSNRWHNRDVVETTTAGDYDITFLSEISGSDAVAAAGTLTVIASPVGGFSGATNDEDATPGRDIEDIEDLRARREEELSLGGATTVDAIRAEVLQVEGVVEVLVEENITDSTVGALTPHSIRVVVWDGDPGLTTDDSIAQAINPAAGIVTVGTESGVYVRSDGSTTTRNFERAAVVDIYVSADIESESGVLADDVKDAIVAAMPTLIGGDVKYNKISAAVFIDGVDDFVSLTIGTAPSPVGTANIAISNTQIAQIDRTNIVLTGDVS